jgi:hypothetical protein
MEQHHNAAVRLRRCHVHIGHPHLLAVIVKRLHADRVGIGKTFEADAVGFARAGLCGMGRHGQQDEKGRS